LETKDTYQTLATPGKEVLFKDRSSKFFGYTFPISSEKEVKPIITDLKKQHHAARHWCYAWQLGTENKTYRANDDGEPSNSAGQPIYGQLQSFDITNTLIIVVRYFGGVKLGVGGLIQAYKTAAKLAIEASTIIEKTININYLILFDYQNMNKVMRIIKEHKIEIIEQNLELSCQIQISVKKSISGKINDTFSSLYGVRIKKLKY